MKTKIEGSLRQYMEEKKGLRQYMKKMGRVVARPNQPMGPPLTMKRWMARKPSFWTFLWNSATSNISVSFDTQNRISRLVRTSPLLQKSVFILVLLVSNLLSLVLSRMGWLWGKICFMYPSSCLQTASCSIWGNWSRVYLQSMHIIFGSSLACSTAPQIYSSLS